MKNNIVISEKKLKGTIFTETHRNAPKFIYGEYVKGVSFDYATTGKFLKYKFKNVLGI